MNKTEFVDWMANRMDTSKAEAARWVDGYWEGVSEALRENGRLDFIGYGTFQKKHRPARMGRNPSNGESIQISASNAATFKAGKRLKEAVN